MTTKDYGMVNDLAELTVHMEKLVSDGVPFGFDTELGYYGPDKEKGSLDHLTNILVGFSYTNSLEWARYVPLAHNDESNLIDHLGVARLLWSTFQTGLMVAHNLSTELRAMAKFFREYLSDDPLFGAAVRDAKGYFPYFSDTMVEAYVLRECEGFYGLKDLVNQKFDHQMIKYEDLFGENLTKKQVEASRFNILPLTPKVITYGCEDALWCLALHKDQYPRVSARFKFIYDLDMQIVQVVCDMEDCGIQFDWNFLAIKDREAKAFLEKLDAEIQSDFKDALNEEHDLNVNLGSPMQLKKIFFDQLGMKTKIFSDKDKTKMSTNDKSLTYLIRNYDYKFLPKISDVRKLKKLISSYTSAFEKQYGDSPDGRIHSSLNQCLVNTARFSSSNPNQQNFPSSYIKEFDDAGKPTGRTLSYDMKLSTGEVFKMNFKDAIIAPEGFYILGFDLGQAEFRVIAGEAKEQSLIDAFIEGVDFHTKTASLMYKVPIEQVTKDLRQKGKTCNFALAFGQTEYALAESLGVSVEEAKRLMDEYFAAIPNVKAWVENQKAFGYKHGGIYTKFGRWIPIPQLFDSRKFIVGNGERACFNYPAQGGGTGDYPRICMVRARKAIQRAGWSEKVRLFMNIHDALEFYVHESLNPADVISVLNKAVIFPVDGWPPMEADWHIGLRLGSVKEITLLDDGSIQIDEQIIHPTIPRQQAIPAQETIIKEEVVPKPVLEISDDIEGNTLIITLTKMPTAEQLGKFKVLLEKTQGSNSIVLKTPSGEKELRAKTSLTPADQGKISFALGGAQVRYKEDLASLQDLASELAF